MQENSPSPPQTYPWLKRALAHPRRVEALGCLMRKQGGTSEGELAGALGMTVPLAAYHLRVLHDANLIAQVEGSRGQGEARSYVAAPAGR